MIKIIKPGKTDFRFTCDKCGCVFEYNVEDIDDSYIKCPTCGKIHYGFDGDDTLTISDLTIGGTKPTEAFRVSTDPCEDCNYTKSLKLNGYYVGDMPCQWCNKNPYRATCTATTLGSSYSSGCTCSSRDCASHSCECESASYDPSCNANCGTLGNCEPTYAYSQYAEPCSCCSEGKEFYTCTAEGVSYEFASDSLGAYEFSSCNLDLSKDEDENK